MIRFIESLPKHFVTACISLHRHMAMTISSISAILVTMLLMGVLLLAGGNIDAFTENVEKEVKIHVSIDSLTKDEQIEKLEKEISSFPGKCRVVACCGEKKYLSIWRNRCD